MILEGHASLCLIEKGIIELIAVGRGYSMRWVLIILIYFSQKYTRGLG